MYPHAVDYVEGDYFEMKDGDVVAYAKPKSERKSFDDERHDTLYESRYDKWVDFYNPKAEKGEINMWGFSETEPI